MSGSGSFAILPAAAIDDTRLAHATLRVLACYLTYANTDGWCRPKQETIALRLEMDRSTVAYHVKKLREYGYIETDKKGKLNYSHVLTPSTCSLKGSVDPINTNTPDVLIPSTRNVYPINMNVLTPSTPERTSKNVPKNEYTTPSHEGVVSARPRTQPPKELITFDAILRDGKGYAPNEHFFTKVMDLYFGKIDVEEIALKVVSWCASQKNPADQNASVARVLNFLKGDLKDLENGGRHQFGSSKEASNGGRQLSVVERDHGSGLRADLDSLWSGPAEVRESRSSYGGAPSGGGVGPVAGNPRALSAV